MAAVPSQRRDRSHSARSEERWRGELDDALRRRRRKDNLTHWLISTQAVELPHHAERRRQDLRLWAGAVLQARPRLHVACCYIKLPPARVAVGVSALRAADRRLVCGRHLRGVVEAGDCDHGPR